MECKFKIRLYENKSIKIFGLNRILIKISLYLLSMHANAYDEYFHSLIFSERKTSSNFYLNKDNYREAMRLNNELI